MGAEDQLLRFVPWWNLDWFSRLFWEEMRISWPQQAAQRLEFQLAAHFEELGKKSQIQGQLHHSSVDLVRHRFQHLQLLLNVGPLATWPAKLGCRQGCQKWRSDERVCCWMLPSEPSAGQLMQVRLSQWDNRISCSSNVKREASSQFLNISPCQSRLHWHIPQRVELVSVLMRKSFIHLLNWDKISLHLAALYGRMFLTVWYIRIYRSLLYNRIDIR